MFIKLKFLYTPSRQGKGEPSFVEALFGRLGRILRRSQVRG